MYEITASTRELKLAAKDALRGKWGVAILTTIIYNLIIMAISFIPLLPFIVMPPLMLGIAIMALSLMRTGSADLENLFDGMKYFFLTVKASLLSMLIIFLWGLIPMIIMVAMFAGLALDTNPMMILISFPIFIIASIPMIIAQLDYILIFFVIADDPSLGAREVLKQSKAMMKGNRMKMFLLMLSFIGWLLLMPLTLFIGYLWLLPYVYVSIAAFYEQLKGSQPTQHSEHLPEF